MFSIMALKIGSEGEKFREKTVSASASPFFFSQNFVTLVADFEPKFKTWSRQIMFYTRILVAFVTNIRYAPYILNEDSSYTSFSSFHASAQGWLCRWWLRTTDATPHEKVSSFSIKYCNDFRGQTVFQQNISTSVLRDLQTSVDKSRSATFGQSDFTN